MISIVCVYNNEKMLNNVLLKGLEHQTAQFELITLDNRNNRFQSATEALNYGGEKATGEYIAFIHQDMWFIDESWLENAEKMLNLIPELGVAGVMGISEEGGNWPDKIRNSTSILDKSWNIAPVENVAEVQTLDECVLIVPQEVFRQIKFDEEVFDGWDCYGPDYCLTAKSIGKSIYVIPGNCRHCCLREQTRPWDFKDLHKYQKRLFTKYKDEYKIIYAWMGEISWKKLRFNDLLNLIGPTYIKLFPGFDSVLASELSGCDSVLDLGCGHFSPVCTIDIPYSVGVELSPTLLEESKRLNIHSEYIAADIRTVEFAENSFDAVIALDVLEHLSKQEGIELIEKMQRWARKSILIKTPNRSLGADDRDDPNQILPRESEWEADELVKLGLKVRGLGGWRKLRPETNYFETLLVALTQKVVLLLPGQAVNLFASWRSG